MDFPKNSALKNQEKGCDVMDFPKNNNQIKGCDVMDSPKNTALKAHNQNIAEKPLIDKMETVEKEFSNLNQKMVKVIQALEAGTISAEEAQKERERIEKELARHRAELDALQKRLKEYNESLKLNSDRLLTLETAVDSIMETDDEIKALLNNAKSIFKRFDELEEKIKKIEEKITKIEEKNHHEHIALKEYLEDRLDNLDKQFFYLYLLFGITIVAVGISIFFHR